ncbi:MAG: DUF5011 domain-containing protein [Lentimicrobiaceae bacterium]|jgi:hypothetical protein|nr:DUF5011 domain-containing protein [Lentimicrobiaceae bacterium]MBT3817906.1 DUF5011 domain-containing protein [Lentimicrobiaceae bacterium]MBT4801626.1 DUF5011 domain-containing protein [Lentimicrobiaceae bacterium]MBT5163629.1 DUF5011 domain-containing protein [Lentimicrobiaceae bacterium]MBT7036583.1 DUF5011 domain-containing protein [Lentimicrobiaceae bacterium]
MKTLLSKINHLSIIFILSITLMMAFLSCKKDNSGDGNSPELFLLGANPLNWAKDIPYEDPGAIAYDVTEYGDTLDLTASIVIGGNVDVSSAGDYSVTYNVTDASGLSADEKVRKVIVVIGK